MGYNQNVAALIWTSWSGNPRLLTKLKTIIGLSSLHTGDRKSAFRGCARPDILLNFSQLCKFYLFEFGEMIMRRSFVLALLTLAGCLTATAQETPPTPKWTVSTTVTIGDTRG